MSNTLFSVDTKKKYRYPGLQGDSLFKAQNFLLWPATHYNSNEPSTIEGKYASRFLCRVFFPPLWSPVITAGRWSIWGVGESVHCIFTFSENATCLLHQCILFLIKCLLQNLSPCAKAWFTNFPPPPTPPLSFPAALAAFTISIFFLKAHLPLNVFWSFVGLAAAVVWSRDLHLRSPSPESVSLAHLAAQLPNGGAGAPASSPSSARRSCGVRPHWARCTSLPPTVGDSGNSGRRPQPQAPPCRTQSLKHIPVPDLSPRRWWDPRTDPRLVKRGHRAAGKALHKGVSRTPGGAGTPSGRASDLEDTWCSGVGFEAQVSGSLRTYGPRCDTQPDFWRRPQNPIRESLIANEFTEIRGVIPGSCKWVEREKS